jgi:hypothetical protein
MTSLLPSLQLVIVALHYRIRTCTPGLNLLENVLTLKKLLQSVAFYSLAHHTRTLANTSPPVALRTHPQSTPATNPRTRKSGGDRQRQRRNRGRKKQQHAARCIHLHAEGDSRSRHPRNLLPLALTRNNEHRRKPPRKRYMPCPRIQ